MRLSLLYFCLLSATLLSAQDPGPWTLERAVAYALENNLQVRQLDYSQQTAELQLRQARNNRLPTISAGSNLSYQLGRTVDPTSNSFAQQNIFSQNINVQASVQLYGGGQIRNTILQREVDARAAALDRRVTANNTGLQVANAYLTVVLTREQLANARRQLDLTTENLSNTDKLIRAGSVPAGQRYDILATQAGNQQTVVELENAVAQNLLQLQLLLELDPSADFDVVAPDLEPTDADLFAGFEPEAVLEAARTTQPTIQAAELRQQSARLGEDVARAGFRPTVGLFANLSTNYSNLAKTFSDEGSEIIFIPTQVEFQGQLVDLGLPQRVGGSIEDISYPDQLNQNFGQLAGISLQVPIFSRGQNKTNLALARLQSERAALDREQAVNQLRSDVETALTDLRAAQEAYRAARVSQEAAQFAYDNAERRYSAGAGNSLDLVTATNRLQQAETNLTRTKYQLIFNREVIEFYLGQGLSLD